jgi:hypothetical protein
LEDGSVLGEMDDRTELGSVDGDMDMDLDAALNRDEDEVVTDEEDEDEEVSSVYNPCMRGFLLSRSGLIGRR